MPRFLACVPALLILIAYPLFAQDKPQPARIDVQPRQLELAVGESVKLQVTAYDSDGGRVETPFLYFSRSRRSVTVNEAGQVKALRPGTFSIVVRAPGGGQNPRLSATVEVRISKPAARSVTFIDPPARLYAGTEVLLRTRVVDSQGTPRDDIPVTFQSNEPQVVQFDPFGALQALRPGKFTITAQAEEAETLFTGRVDAFPATTIQLELSTREARTGDVIQMTATALDALGRPVDDAPLAYSCLLHRSGTLDSIGGAAQIDQPTARFVAEQPGTYTLIASCGGLSARQTVAVRQRAVQRRLELVGRGPVRDVHTSDLWVWEGVDGRDYAVTGTWGGDGEAHFWDVTDPRNIRKVSTVQVDARTVNDVKVSADGRLCIISREGASNRKNGIVLYDVSNPAAPTELCSFHDGLTGGVHNLFIYQQHVYAINNGRRYDILNIENPAEPRRVGRFELDTPGHSVHDVWVADGLAYSSNWGDGLYIVDVGNGVAGGSPGEPVVVSKYAIPNGAHHAAFPYHDAETGKSYVICGDERFPYGLSTRRKPTIAGGYLHFVDVTDPRQPREVARYEIPGAGSHNFWVVGDVLYIAMYNAGLRVLDISGDLLGDLGRQGREIAHYLPFDDEGVIPNGVMVWGPQPHKGSLFFSDWNSGLWAVRLLDE